MRAMGALGSVAWCIFFAWSVTAAAADPVADAVQAHLAAGEFGVARQLAMAAPANQRAALLQQVAAAQNGAGARRAAIATAGSQTDDLARANSLAQLAGGPVARGGGPVADFDTLIDLITSTIAPTTWEDAGGPGAIDGFPGGVYVDPAGVLRKVVVSGPGLDELRGAAAQSGGNRDARKSSPLRKVSLTRLEKQVQLLWAQGRGPDATMRHLAGLQSVKYVFVYPATGDIVLAGPAGDWRMNEEGRAVAVEGGQPVLWLDDLVVLLRNALGPENRFGCSITPTRDNLAATKAFLAESSKSPLRSDAQRMKWLAQLRDTLGKQDIEVYGIDPRTRAARVLVEADYRMKLIGMGLEEGTLGVSSYLSQVKVAADGTLPPMDVLRWWFTLNYDAVSTTSERNAFAFTGQGVKVLSENELLTARGERVHTGKSDELNSEFARSFTKHFEALAAKYPIYAELQNVFDLALAVALIRAENLPDRVQWNLTHFGPKGAFEPELGVAPRQVETVINHRLINGKHVVAGVSGGVTVDPRDLVQRAAVKVDAYGRLDGARSNSQPDQVPAAGWWWD